MGILSYFGFIGLREFFLSLVRPKVIAKVWYMWAFLTPLFAVIEQYMGIKGPLFLAFFALNFMELVTGISAAKAEKKPINSDKMQRFFIKFFIYVSLIAATFQYKIFTVGKEGHGSWSSEFFGWAHFGILSGLSIVLIRSIFENLHRMGVKEAGIIYGLLDNKWTRAFAILASPPDKEKAERE